MTDPCTYYLTLSVRVSRFGRRRGGPEIGEPLRFPWACHPMGYEGANNPYRVDPDQVRSERIARIEEFAAIHPEDRIVVTAFFDGSPTQIMEINASDEPGYRGEESTEEIIGDMCYRLTRSGRLYSLSRSRCTRANDPRGKRRRWCPKRQGWFREADWSISAAAAQRGSGVSIDESIVRMHMRPETHTG